MYTRILLILGLVFMSFALKAQNRLAYGLNLNFNAPMVQQKQTGFSSNGGLGGGMFMEIPFSPMSLSFSNRIQFNSVSYFSPTIGSNVRSDNFELNLGVKEYFASLDSSALFLHITPSYTSLSSSLNGPKAATQKRVNYSNSLNHRFDFGISPGMEIQLSQRVGLELSYTFYVNTTANDSLFDGRPNMLRLGLNLRFGGQDKSGGLKKMMRESLEGLSKDTLYIVNRSCSDKMTDDLLNQLFEQYYDHSAMRIISDEEIGDLSRKNEDHFFAIVGALFGGESEPESTGIYLLNSEFEICDFPFPVLTTYRDPMGAPCFDNRSISAQAIITFNKRLKNRS